MNGREQSGKPCKIATKMRCSRESAEASQKVEECVQLQVGMCARMSCRDDFRGESVGPQQVALGPGSVFPLSASQHHY